MATLTPTQDYAHLLRVDSGANFMHDLQYISTPATDEEWNRGSLVSLDASGNLIAGCADTAMPMWSINASDDYDVSAEAGGTTGPDTGCYVATGGYEITTTEFVAGTYAVNEFLTAGTGTNAGKVTNSPAAYNTRVIVGCVSQGVRSDVYSQSTLTFWTMFIPKVKTT